MNLELDKQQRDAAVDKIKSYFSEERDESLGDLAAGLVLDFFIEQIGPNIYNQGLADARAWFAKKMEGLEIDFTLLFKE